MEPCSHCKTEETALYEGGVPICLKCVAQREAKAKNVREFLVRDLRRATLQVESATTEFNAVTGDIPSFIPQPDQTQRIHNASRALSAARDEMMRAHRHLNDFIERGIVPEDLPPKRSG